MGGFPSWALASRRHWGCSASWPCLSRSWCGCAFHRRSLAPGARASLALRCAVLLGITFALSGFALQLPASAQTLVVVVDRSASMETSLAGEAATVERLRTGLHADDRFGIVTFGGDAVVEQPVVTAANSAFSGFATQPNANATDMEGALRLGASLLPGDTRKHIVILSDGRQNTGDVLTEVALLRQAGIRVDVLPVNVPTGPEVLVASLRGPTSVPPGSSFAVRAIISSNVATAARVTISDDGTVVVTRQLTLAPGDNEVDATLAPASPGMHDIRVNVTPALDTFEQNNSSDTLVQVLGPQRVLIAEGSPGEGANVAAALHAAGIQATVVDPASLPNTPTAVAGYQAVALVDVSAQQLTLQQMDALRSATENLGVGLSAFGGTNTFGPGGFSGTPLETALPVNMQVRNPQQKPPVSVVLVLEFGGEQRRRRGGARRREGAGREAQPARLCRRHRFEHRPHCPAAAGGHSHRGGARHPQHRQLRRPFLIRPVHRGRRARASRPPWHRPPCDRAR